MQSFQITSTKTLMSSLLTKDIFDIFLLEELTLCTMNTFTIDGRINREFFPANEQNEDNIPYEFRCWSDIKNICYELIKGKYTPSYFKVVLHIKPEKYTDIMASSVSEATLSQLKALVLNIKYDGSKAILTTATAYNTFTMDKDPDRLWDKYMAAFLSSSGLSYESL